MTGNDAAVLTSSAGFVVSVGEHPPITTAATMAARAMTNPRIPDECRYRRVSTGGARCWVETARRLPGVNEANSLTKTGTSNTEKSDPQRHE